MAPATVKPGDDRIIICFDFGTTYSGASYTFQIPGKAPEIVTIMEYPGLEGYLQPKVPTVIVYDDADPTKFKWGGQVAWRDPAARGVKLMLDPNQLWPDYLPALIFQKDFQSLPKDPADVAADFLGALYKHALDTIESCSVREYFAICEKEFVLSVPAVWSDKAKDLTLKAAEKAGIHPVTLIKEPEAAALYTLTSFDHSLKVGNSLVVCDAGGGTIDLITYEILAMEPYLKLSELVPGTGAMAGSMLLDKRFEQAVQRLLGEDQFAKLKTTVGWAKARNDFEKIIKTAFTGDLADVHYVMFPKANLKDDEANGLVGNCWELTGDILQDIFAPIMHAVQGLVSAQINGACQKRPGQSTKAIFLVGGFGSSRYLKKLLEKTYKPMGIQVIQPHDAWAAIVKGGALSRVVDKATVVSSQAVRNYGVSAHEPFDPIADRGRPSFVKSSSGETRVIKMTWYIRKGNDLMRDKAIKLPFFRHIKKQHNHRDLVFFEELYYCDSETAPVYPGADMKELCTVTADFRGVDKKLFKAMVGFDGVDYLEVKYDLCLSTANANLKFSLEFRGKEMGSAAATYI